MDEDLADKGKMMTVLYYLDVFILCFPETIFRAKSYQTLTSGHVLQIDHWGGGGGGCYTPDLN